MARPKVPTIPDNKILFFQEQLYRELSHMFEWKGLPSTVPQDYLERTLIRHGYVLYYEDENIGQDVLRCDITGFNRHELPTQARTYSANTIDEKTTITRNIKRLADYKNVTSDFDPKKDGVLIMNMADNKYGIHHTRMIVEHFAERLALAQMAFDTNLLWANIPYIFQTNNDDTRLSIEKMFAGIFSGEPFIIVDKHLLMDNADRTGVPTGIKFIGKELIDVQNEIMMKFRQTVGFDTAGVDKAERVNTLEIQSNNQHTRTVLEIMLSQRKLACETINEFFGANLSVDILQPEMKAVERGEEFGSDDRPAGTSDNEDEL